MNYGVHKYVQLYVKVHAQNGNVEMWIAYVTLKLFGASFSVF